MTIASEFISMAKEMLDDKELGSDGTLVNPSLDAPDSDQPWKTTSTPTSYPMRLFYDSEGRKTVNGSLVESGEKVFITYEPDGINLERCVGWDFIDHTSRNWKVLAVEPVSAGNTNVICYVKIGS